MSSSLHNGARRRDVSNYPDLVSIHVPLQGEEVGELGTGVDCIPRLEMEFQHRILCVGAERRLQSVFQVGGNSGLVKGVWIRIRT